MARVLRIVLIALAGVVGVVGLAVGGVAFHFWYHNSYKSVVQTLEVPQRGFDYVLMTDISGFEDPAWYVYEIPRGAGKPKTIRTGHDHSEAIFWNYDEANDLTENPRLELVDGRYVLFWRGGLRFSLYDTDKREVLVNDEAPWASFQDAGGEAKFGPRGQSNWVRENLDLAIRSRLEPSSTSPERTRDR